LEQSFVERERFRLLNHDPAEISMPRVEEVIPFLTNNGGADLQNGQGSLSSHASPKARVERSVKLLSTRRSVSKRTAISFGSVAVMRTYPIGKSCRDMWTKFSSTAKATLWAI